MDKSIFKNGEFFVGCNYWASHAGTNMWHDWRPDVVEADLKNLAEHNLKHIRIFPLWPDFQPLKMHRACHGADKEIRMGEDPLPFTEAGRAGVSEEMCERFQTFCDLAEKYGIKLVVGLITGWMSGRLYVPDLFEKVNVTRDPLAIKWEIKFVKYMVRRFKSHPAIVAWDLGNECDCLANVGDQNSAYVWVSTITNAIKTEDNTRPVVSGMHGTTPDSLYRSEDLGEILDILCTHPYPIFTPHCNTDPVNENKSVFHAVAETLFYRGTANSMAFAEETGTLGPFISSNAIAADYANTVMHLLWAHNCLGMMWWCAFEQSHLEHTPYEWNTVERELGLFYQDYTPKPIVAQMTDFQNYTESFKYKKLTGRILDAVCVLTAEHDNWLPALGTFTLTKQAGLDVEFVHCNDEIPEARAYILPSYDHYRLSRRVWLDLMERVKRGAKLYISIGNGILSPFKEFIGLEPQLHYVPTKPDHIKLGDSEFWLNPTFKVPYANCTAEVLATDDDGTPVMSKNKLGEGCVYFLTYPIENMAGKVPGINSGASFKPLYKFYEEMTELRNPEKVARKDNPHIAITEHIVDDSTRVIIAVNCVPRESAAAIAIDGWKLSETLRNQGSQINAADGKIELVMKGNSAVILEIKK